MWQTCLATVTVSNEQSDTPNYLSGTLHGNARRLVRMAMLAMLRPLLSLRLIGLDLIPIEGPLLVVSNHLSNADPIILEFAFPRPLFFMGKVELFANPIFRWFLLRFGGFPVERGTADRAALRRAQAVLKQGIAVGIYPEGGRSKSASLVKGLAGAGLIALQSQAPVVPVAITGTEFFPVNGDWPMRRPREVPRGVTIRCGAPFSIPERVDGRRVTPEEATTLMMLKIAALLPERYHGVYRDEGVIEAPGEAPSLLTRR
ncbi:MAG: 1-acyl-sn-glycerol-3-phosphate acyltransferase [Chloroflexia bacterium]|nr:1-acyl-sn-glycerol-3-phosphate acyltransferase [Chloroflexia bacterium]